MGRRGRNANPWKQYPELLTFISSVSQKLEKVEWNFSRYEEQLFRRPCKLEDVNFAALDFCVAAVSLRDWVKTAVLQTARASPEEGLPATECEFYAFIRENVRHQNIIEAIGNASKHGSYDDRNFEGGVVQPSQFVAGLAAELEKNPNCSLEDVSWFDLAIQQRGSRDVIPGYVAFGDALDDWKKLVVELIEKCIIPD